MITNCGLGRMWEEVVVVYLRGSVEDLIVSTSCIIICSLWPAFTYAVRRIGANTHCWATERFTLISLQKIQILFGKCF
jgi:hypothetical protein